MLESWYAGVGILTSSEEEMRDYHGLVSGKEREGYIKRDRKRRR